MALLGFNVPMDESRRPTVSISTLGCRVNQADSDAYAQRFADAGFSLVPPDACADVCLLNSCTVTNVSDQKSRQLVQRLRRANPDALLAVTGCYAAMAPARVEQVTGADLVAGLPDKERLVDLVNERLAERGFARPQPLTIEQLMRAKPHTRLNVKVQDGCNDFCSFCIVPFSRGRARSVPLESIVASVNRAVREGYQEVVLTGVNITAYGRDSGSHLGLVLRAVLDRTEVPRVRLSSIEPFRFDPNWLGLWESGRLCRHLHLPLQSGCQATLGRMRRRYDASGYARLIAKIRGRAPGMAIWADVIAGFPGETDEEFEESLAFVKDMDFAGIHVFRYSPRTGTRAARMEGRVPDAVKKDRAARLIAESEQGKRRFAARLVGTTARVLFEEPGAGLTDNYVRVQARGGQPNHFAQVRLTGPSRDGLLGEIVDG